MSLKLLAELLIQETKQQISSRQEPIVEEDLLVRFTFGIGQQ